MLFDAHLHISDEYNPLDENKAKELINNAEKNGIKYLVSNSTCPRSLEENIYLMKKYKSVMCGIGIFPTEFKTEKNLDYIDLIRTKVIELKKDGFGNRIIFGEVGLDFKDEKSNKDLQQRALIEILKIAKEHNLYLEIHSRFAVKQIMQILEQFDYNKIIMHWFLDSKKYIDRAVKLGYYVTIGPKYLYDQNLIDNIKDIPKEQILFETDYPAGVSGKIHEPEMIKEIFNKYCKDFDISKEEMQSILDESFSKIFNIEQ